MPLAMALLNVSNPTLGAMDALSRLSHDTDAEVAQNAVMALGVRPKQLLMPINASVPEANTSALFRPSNVSSFLMPHQRAKQDLPFTFSQRATSAALSACLGMKCALQAS